MNIQSAKAVIKAAVAADDAVIIEGIHGIGKSQIVQQFAKEEEYHLEELFLSHQEVGDIIGIPFDFEDEDGNRITSWSIPIWLQRFNEAAAAGKKCILFLDELNRAPTDVRQSALQLVLERKIHEHTLPVVNGERTMIVSAINPADEYQVDELDPALLDRFLHINIEVCAKTWLTWAKVNDINNIVIDYIIENSKKLHWTPQDGGTGASPRSWSKLSNYMHNLEDIDTEILFQIIKGKIGKEIGSQFYSFAKDYVKVIKVEDVEAIVKEHKDADTIEEIASHITELMGEAEAIQKSEMADKLRVKYANKKDMLPYVAYLYSLEIEICVSYLKAQKSDNPDEYKKLAAFDSELNNKKLFLRIIQAADRT